MELIKRPAGAPEQQSLEKNLFRLIPYWPVFTLLLLISLAAAWLYLNYTTPLYETTARVLFRDDKKGAEESKTFQSLDVISPKRSVDNEIEIFQSTALMEQVVKDLNLYAPVYRQDQLRDVLAYTSSPVSVSSNAPDSLKQVKTIPFTLRNGQIIIGQSAYPLNRLVQTPFGNLKFSANPNLVQADPAGTLYYFSLLAPRKVVVAIASKLKVVVTNKLTSVIDIELRDENPARGENILNDLILAFDKSIEQEKNNLATNTAKFIDDRLTTVENNMLNIEHQQQSYTSNKGAVDIGTQGKLYLENVSTNDQKVGEINMQLSVLGQIENYVRSKNLSNGIVPSTVGVNDAGLTQMVKNIYDLQLELENNKRTTGENNPMVLSVKDKIEKIRPQILENLENERQSLTASRDNLSKTNQGYSSQLQTMPATQKKLVDISRELNIKSDIYTFLLQKKEETSLSFITKGSNSKILNKPESSEFPVSPKNKIVYLASMLLSFILCMGIVTARETLRSNIMYQTEIESLTQLPVICEIAAGDPKNPLIIGSSQRTLVAEQFRKLRTTLGYLGIGGTRKRILITSAISGEGKSFVALNLANSLALTGKKIVLLDFDLTNPSLHIKLNVKKEIGITEYLQEKKELESILNKTSLNENLFFISAGTLPSNPSELITGPATGKLLNKLDAMFDFIIIDVSPVGPVSDGYILSALCDATLFIIRHGYTPKSFVERMDKNNKLNKLTNAAIVFNDVSMRNFNSYGYGYDYLGKNDKYKLNEKND